jgi:hypothetical protein
MTEDSWPSLKGASIILHYMPLRNAIPTLRTHLTNDMPQQNTITSINNHDMRCTR